MASNNQNNIQQNNQERQNPRERQPRGEYRTRSERTHYERLGVPQRASAAEIKKVFRDRVKSLHPDFQSNGSALSVSHSLDFVSLSRSYEILSDPMRRARYDAWLAMRSAPKGEWQRCYALAKNSLADGLHDTAYWMKKGIKAIATPVKLVIRPLTWFGTRALASIAASIVFASRRMGVKPRSIAAPGKTYLASGRRGLITHVDRSVYCPVIPVASASNNGHVESEADEFSDVAPIVSCTEIDQLEILPGELVRITHAAPFTPEHPMVQSLRDRILLPLQIERAALARLTFPNSDRRSKLILAIDDKTGGYVEREALGVIAQILAQHNVDEECIYLKFDDQLFSQALQREEFCITGSYSTNAMNNGHNQQTID